MPLVLYRLWVRRRWCTWVELTKHADALPAIEKMKAAYERDPDDPDQCLLIRPDGVPPVKKP